MHGSAWHHVAACASCHGSIRQSLLTMLQWCWWQGWLSGNPQCICLCCGATGDMQQLWLLELLGLWLPPGWHRRSASSSKHHYSHHELAAKAE